MSVYEKRSARSQLDDSLTGVVVDTLFIDQRFDNGVLTGGRFQNCTFANISFKQATLTDCHFSNCVFEGCYFRDTAFTDCHFHLSSYWH